MLSQEILDTSWASGPDTYIYALTSAYLDLLDGELTESNMSALTLNQHTLLAYRILLDEVKVGGFIQLIQNGYGPYVLAGPFPMMIKKEWGLTDFGKFMYEVRKEYLRNKSALESEQTDEGFMAMYEEFDTMNNYGDDFLDMEEEVSTLVANYVRDNEKEFVDNLFSSN